MPDFGKMDCSSVHVAPCAASANGSAVQLPDAADGSESEITKAPGPAAERVREALRDVIDAERGCNIVDLGLVYDVEVVGRTVRITMTMTAPDSPARGHILSGVRERMKMIDGVGGVEIDLIWQPPWSLQRMNRAATHGGAAQRPS